MTDPQPPDWAIKVFPGVHQDRPQDFQAQGLPQTQVDQFTDWSSNVAGKDELAAGTTPVAGSAVSGSVQTNSVGVAPATSVAVTDTNMLLSQNFSSASTVAVGGNWSWYGDDGHLTNGCARVLCTGTLDELVSNEVPVVPSERVQVTVWVKWSGLTYTGSTPITLGIEKYRKGRDTDSGGTTYLDIGGTDLTSLASPGSSGGWKQLTGTYTIPSSGVDQIRARLRVKATATDGVVLWDEIELKKLDLIPDSAVPGIGAANDNVVNNLQGKPGSGYTSSDVATAYQNTANALTSANAKIAVIDATGGSGSVAADDFSWTGEITASANWDGYYTQGPSQGTYNANGSDAVWTPPGAVTYAQPACVFSYEGTGATSTTDYQKINMVLDSGIGLGDQAYYYGRAFLIGRMSSDRYTYMRLQINGTGTAGIYKVVSGGTPTLIGSTVPTGSVGTGTSIDFYCGNKDTTELNRFKAFINGVLILDVTDSGTVYSGAPYRRWGWGGCMDYQPSYAVPIPGTFNGYAYYGNFFVNPPKINQWIAQDQ